MSTGFWLNYLLALGVVGLMLFGLYAIVRGVSRGRLLAGSDKALVNVIATTSVAQNTAIHVVRAGSKYLLVGGGAGQLRTLGEIPEEDVETWVGQQRTLHDAQVRSIANVWTALRGKR